MVALTGAGISVPSGIPDFRTPGTGLWENVDPMEVAHIDAWRADPSRFWHFYGDRFATLDGKEPNGAHRALVALEARGKLDAVVTQNIDRLHRKAGSTTLVEVHGSIDTSSCLDCGARLPLAEVRDRLAAAGDGVPRCDCGAALKPDVVLFGEWLPPRRSSAPTRSPRMRTCCCASARRSRSTRSRSCRGSPVRRRRGGDRHAGADAVSTATPRSSSTATSSPSSRRSWRRSDPPRPPAVVTGSAGPSPRSRSHRAPRRRSGTRGPRAAPTAAPSPGSSSVSVASTGRTARG